MDLLADLNEPQRQAVVHADGPLLVLAGAGSGKTRIITRRTAYLIDQGVAAPREVLAITFTNKAAGEMRERIETLHVPPGATVCTFHSLCARLLREFAAEAKLAANYTIYDRNDQLKLVKEAISRLGRDSARLTPSIVHSHISNAKNGLKTPEDCAADAGDFHQRNVAKVYSEYERLLGRNNALDFDDLLLRMACLLRDRPEIRELFGRRYRYVLVDEYQDTNHAQYLIAHGIAMDHENLCVTGDPDQSIYAWRGADINNILQFEADYPNAIVVRLEENYRSTRPILAAASRLISRNVMRKGKKLWTHRRGGVDVRVVFCDDAQAEAALVAERLGRFRDAGGDLDDATVFYRLNSLSRVMEEALMRASVPYRVARGVEFYNRKEIKDVLAYLKLIVNPADDLSCARIINTPTRGIGAKTVNRLAMLAESKGVSLLAACELAEKAGLGAAAVKKVSAFAKLIASMAGDPDRPVREIAEDVVRLSGLEEALGSGGEDALQARANIFELVSSAKEFDERSDGGTLADYLHDISLVSDLDHYDGASRGAVTLMTLHAAKGLEFSVVFILGCEDGLLPFSREGEARWSGEVMEDLEEERRLAFVGMTRAKDELTLSCARRRMIHGQTVSQAASRFLNEIGADGVVVEDATTSAPVATAHSRKRAVPKGGFYADVDERAAIEAMETKYPFPPEYEYLKAGSMVHHRQFGRGRVVRLRQPWPETRAEIVFEDCGRKTIVLAKTSIELL